MGEDVTRDCAQWTAQANATVQGIRQKTGQVTDLPAFSDLPSGSLLAAEFNRKGTELGQNLDELSQILTDMMNTFVAAGKGYKSTEELSSSDFNGIDTAPSAAFGSNPPEPGALKPADLMMKPGAGLFPHGGPGVPLPPTPTLPSDLSTMPSGRQDTANSPFWKDVASNAVPAEKTPGAGSSAD